MGAKFGHIVTEKTRKKLRDFNLGKKASQKTRDKISKAVQNGYDNGTRKPYWLGRRLSEEHKEKMSNSLKGKSYEELMGKEKARELIEKRKLGNKGQFKKGQLSWNKGKPHRKETREKLRKIGLEMWKNEDYKKEQVSKILKGLMKRPTSYEKRISELCIENNLPFIYCGNGTFILGGKNPDFIHRRKNIVIEVYNRFHHPKNYEEIRKKHFENYGYKVIFIREKEVLHKEWKNICLEKLNINNVK